MSDIDIQEITKIGENDYGYKFGVGLLDERWQGFALGKMESGEKMLFFLPNIEENGLMGVSDRDLAIKLTGAIAQNPAQAYGGVARWFVPEELRGKPDDYRCADCGEIPCCGECQFLTAEEEWSEPDISRQCEWADHHECSEVGSCVCPCHRPDEAKDYNLGPCHACGGAENVRNVVTLPLKSPTPGIGWGCFQCKLANDGAMAVFCDACIEAGKQPLRAFKGYPGDKETVRFETLTGTHEHDMRFHPELTAGSN